MAHYARSSRYTKLTNSSARVRPIQRALISTSDKTGLIEFVQSLVDLGIEIIATAGTAILLKKNNIAVTTVSEYTGFPEIMDGRVKTLHPKIFAGLLAREGIDDEVLSKHQIQPINLLVINLYPFQTTAANPQATSSEIIEQIDVGGPSLLRAGAKNFNTVTVVVDPNDYPRIIDKLKIQQGMTSLTLRQQLAQKVFSYLAQYDTDIAHYLNSTIKTNSSSPFPEDFLPHYHKKMDLRYGENPHQKAAFYTKIPAQPHTFSNAKQLQGKSLSYNNLVDSDAAVSCVYSLPHKLFSCVIIKHATPCGVAEAETLSTAYEKALACDPMSAFGGIIAFNATLDAVTAKKILARQFVEVIIAPAVDKDALSLLSSKPSVRILVYNQQVVEKFPLELKYLSGGLLLQEPDLKTLNINELNIVSKRQPTQQEVDDLLFAWQVAKFTKSNAIVYAKDKATLGIGTGQTSRVFAAKIAALKAKEANLSLTKAVMASDAFFPFADGIEVAASAGITAVIQPGGSKRDNEVIAAANQANLAMIFTGIRHLRH